MPPEILELIAQLMQVIQRLGEWLADAPRQESWPSRWIAPLLPALLGGAVGAGFVALLTSRVQRGLIDYQERIRAFDVVLSPLREALNEVRPRVVATQSYARGAPSRFSAVEPFWRDVHRLLRHPLHIHLPTSTLQPVHDWDWAENSLQGLWEDGRAGSPAERAAFVLLVIDSSLSADRLRDLPERDIDRATQAAFPAPGEDTLREARETLLADPTILDQMRARAEEWHAMRRRTETSITEALSVLEDTIRAGPGRNAAHGGVFTRWRRWW